MENYLSAEEWLEQGLSKIDDPVGCLQDCWIAFNSLYSAYDIGNSERSTIKRFITSCISEDFAEELINSNQTNISYLTSRPVINMSDTTRNTQRDISSYRSSNEYVSKLKSIMMIIYQVRCNLFHGEKSRYIDRDVTLCKHSWPFVAEITRRQIQELEE